MDSYYEIQRRHARPIEESETPCYPLYPATPAFGSYSPLPAKPVIKASFNDLPTELVLKIFTGLNRVASTCLGLSCRSLYGMHRRMYGSVPLVSYVQPSRNRIYESTDSLFIRLTVWMGPEYVFDGVRGRFVREKRGPDGEGRWEGDWRRWVDDREVVRWNGGAKYGYGYG